MKDTYGVTQMNFVFKYGWIAEEEKKKSAKNNNDYKMLRMNLYIKQWCFLAWRWNRWLTAGGISSHLRFRSCLWSAVFPKSFFFGDFGVEVHKRRDQDVGGIHDLVAHDDVGKRHIVKLLLGVGLNWLDLGFSYEHLRKHNDKSE